MGLFKPNIQKLQERQDIPGLVKALTYTELEVRQASMAALIQVGMQAGEPQVREQVCQAILTALKNNDVFVRRAAANSLDRITTQIKDIAFLEKIQENLQNLMNDSDSYVREYTAKALGQFGEKAIPFLLAPLYHSQLMHNLGIDSFLPSSLIQNSAKDERLPCIKALGQTGDIRVVYLLLKYLGEEVDDNQYSYPSYIRQRNVILKQTIHNAIGQLGDVGVEGLTVLLANENDKIRTLAAETLGVILKNRESK